MTKVSVCIPTFNNEKYIAQAIESVLIQNYDNYEIVIIDDNSSDKTVDIIEEFAKNNRKISFYKNDINLGIVGNFNKCLNLCKGEFVKFLLADDIFLRPDSLRIYVTTIERYPDVSIVSSARKLIDAESKHIGNVFCYEEGLYTSGTNIINDCLLHQKNKIGEPTSVIIRRNSLNREFDYKYKQLLDLEMWFHLLENNSFYYIKENLVGFRIHEDQTTKKNKKNFLYLRDFPLLLQEYCQKSYIKFRSIKLLLGLVRHNDKTYSLYKKDKLSLYDVKKIVNENMSFCLFVFLRPFYKILKNVFRLHFLR
jgi:glycosyltransferase involved in cell wall biosynthesis